MPPDYQYHQNVRGLQDEYIKFDDHKFKPNSSKTVGLSAQSIHGVIKIIRLFYTFLVLEGLTDYNPLETIKNISYVDKEIDIMKVDEIKALFAALDQRKYADFRDYVLMTILLDGMLRINEAVSLRKDDIDYNGNTVHIRAANTKTRKGRIVPVDKRTVRLIKELISDTDIFDNQYIFLANYGEQLTTNHFRNRLNRLAIKVGIRKFTPTYFAIPAQLCFLNPEEICATFKLS